MSTFADRWNNRNATEEEPEQLSLLREEDLGPHTGEDLREFYITPFFIETMAARARQWNDDHLRRQLGLFRRTIADYPEVLETLEGELHRRNLNKLYRHARRLPPEQLKALLAKYSGEPDFKEVIETEIELRKGVTHLHDASGET